MQEIPKRKSTNNLIAAPNKFPKTEHPSAPNYRQETLITQSMKSPKVNDNTETPALRPRKYTEKSLSSKFAPAISLLHQLPTDLRGCTIHFDDGSTTTARKLQSVTATLQEILDADDWSQIEETETGEWLLQGMEGVEKAILNSAALSDEGMSGIYDAAWELAGTIERLIGEPYRWGPEGRVLTSFLEQDWRVEEGRGGEGGGEDMVE